MFSFPGTGLLTLLKIEKKLKGIKNIYFYLFGLRTFDTKFVSRELNLWEFKNHPTW
jgi:hypothetical protein